MSGNNNENPIVKIILLSIIAFFGLVMLLLCPPVAAIFIIVAFLAVFRSKKSTPKNKDSQTYTHQKGSQTYQEYTPNKERVTPDDYKEYKTDEDVVIPKPKQQYLGYQETLDNMYTEHYEAMQFYLNLKMHLEDYPSDPEFMLGKVACTRFKGNTSPKWHEAFFLLDMNGILSYIVYNNGTAIYTLKNQNWYVAKLPLEQQEPNLKKMY